MPHKLAQFSFARFSLARIHNSASLNTVNSQKREYTVKVPSAVQLEWNNQGYC